MPSPGSPGPGPRFLVLGVGNPARQDDGVGMVVAERVARVAPPGVEVRTLPQLQVELAEDFAAFDRVIIIDAAMSGPAVELRRVRAPAGAPAPAWSHEVTLETLGGLARALYGRCPELFVCAVRGARFGYGEALSATARRRAAVAFREVMKLVRGAVDER